MPYTPENFKISISNPYSAEYISPHLGDTNCEVGSFNTIDDVNSYIPPVNIPKICTVPVEAIPVPYTDVCINNSFVIVYPTIDNDGKIHYTASWSSTCPDVTAVHATSPAVLDPITSLPETRDGKYVLQPVGSYTYPYISDPAIAYSDTFTFECCDETINITPTFDNGRTTMPVGILGSMLVHNGIKWVKFDAPTSDGTYGLTVSVSGGSASVGWTEGASC